VSLADGSASGRFYDVDTDELVEIAVGSEDGRLSVDLGDVSAERVTLAIHGANPDAVVVDGEPLAAVDADPAAGEWTASETAVTVVV